MMMTRQHDMTITEAGNTIAAMAMKLVARHPRLQHASSETLDAVVNAMKAAAGDIVDELLRDLKEAPTLADYATHAAVLKLALAGMAPLGE